MLHSTLRNLLLAGLIGFSGAFSSASAQCTADAGTLSGYKPTDCLLSGGTLIGGIPNGDAVVPAGFQTVYVLTEGPNLVIQQAGASPNFTVNSIGSYTIHTLVYDPATLDLNIVVPGTTTGFDVNSLLIQGGGSICASLDVSGTQVLVDNPDAGSLNATSSQVCLTGGAAAISANVNSAPYVPAGYTTIYVLTSGPGLVIVDAGASPSFNVSSTGDYTIHTLVYDPDVLNLGVVQFGTTTGFDVNGLLYQGGGNICGALDVAGAPVEVISCPPPCTADAGSLSGYKPSDCVLPGGTVIGGIPNGDAVVPPGYVTGWVLTEGTGLVIQDVGNDPIFVVNSAGSYTIHTLVYDPNTLDLTSVVIGITTGFDVNSLLIQGGGTICASLDVTGTNIVVDNPDAGTLVADSAEFCLSGGSATVSATQDVIPYVPSGYSTVYVLTEGPGLVIVDAGASPSFTVSDTGNYTIHTLIYDPGVLNLGVVQFGVTTGFDVNGLLYQGGGNICGALDVAGAPVSVVNCVNTCAADAGTFLPDTTTYCISPGGDEDISATHDIAPTVPAGFSVIYVLTEGPGLTIVDVNATADFTVTSVGDYTIHTLVYDPNTLDLTSVVIGTTTGVDVNNLLIQGGGSICGSLDVAGVSLPVIPCTATCSADAGTLMAAASMVCLDNDTALLSASHMIAPTVPAGYSTLYVLTQGGGLTIVGASATPDFLVSDTGLFTIHTLVYDPNTLDLNTVVFGTTTGFDVNSLLIQGGGSICASLDVAGAPIMVEDCSQPCVANAGGLIADSATYCLDNSGILISATPDGNAVVPPGYETVYVLTQGPDLVLLQANPTPVFSISDTGSYTIHTLVYDPLTLNLSSITFGTTVAVDVLGLLVQGGGLICASLDVAGASISVIDCGQLCTADAGTLTAVASGVCFDSLFVDIAATPDNNANVPAGYSTVYVLTSGTGLVIEQVSVTSQFSVTDTGLYTIHTLVYDTATLDLSGVNPGVTTGFDVNGLLIQGGGFICASLDVAGAQVQVDLCSSSCLANAGTITADSASFCLTGGTAMISATSDNNATVPPGYTTIYVLTSGPGLVIEQVSGSPMFTVADTGLYTIHTLVYDSLTLDLSGVTPGVTTGVDVNGLLIQGGGLICASLDVAGAPVIVELCSNACVASAGTISAAQATYCLDALTVDIIGIPDNNAVVPAGYQTAYVLTQGPNLVIAQAGASPMFTVADTGSYIIHTLVYDPLTLNLGIITPGATAAVDVLGLLIQGGGTICASLDVAGAPIQVELCPIVTGNGESVAGGQTMLSLWPNPTVDHVNIRLTELPKGVYTVSAIDVRGAETKLIQQIVVDGSNELISVDVNGLERGAYTLMVQGDNHIGMGRLMKTR